jgi:hypothetical protein
MIGDEAGAGGVDNQGYLLRLRSEEPPSIVWQCQEFDGPQLPASWTSGLSTGRATPRRAGPGSSLY